MASRSTTNCRDLRVQRTYKLLKDSFVQLLAQKTFEQITVQEICETAMVRRTTFYQHFEDKEDFLLWFVRERQQEFAQSRPENGMEEDVRAHYVGMARRMLRYLSENEKGLRTLLGETVHARMMVDAFSDACVEDVIRRIEAVPDYREKLNGMPPVLAAEYYVGGLVAVTKWWFANNKPCTEEELISHLCRMIEEKRIL